MLNLISKSILLLSPGKLFSNKKSQGYSYFHIMQRKWPKINPECVNYEFEFFKKAVSKTKNGIIQLLH